MVVNLERDAGAVVDALVSQLESRDVSLPITFPLQGDGLVIDAVLRHFPGRRLVCRGVWQGRPVVVKLFAGTRKAGQEYEHEQAMLSLLHEHRMPAPAMLHHEVMSRLRVLVLEYLDGVSAEQVFRSADRAEGQEEIANLVDLVARLHRLGVVQEDIHLNNFLRVQGQWYLIDAGGMRLYRQRVPAVEALDNLAWLLAQFPPLVVPSPASVVAGYEVHAFDADDLVKRLDVVRQKRLRMIERKTMRECTEYVPVHVGDLRGMVRRDKLPLAMEMLNTGLDQLIGEGDCLKDGNSATVAAHDVRGMKVVIKRYNVKNLKKWAVRQWRSRAINSWKSAAFLTSLGVETPEPVMFMRRRAGLFFKEDYLVTTHVTGESLPAVCSDGGQQRERALWGMSQLYALMRLLRFSHGDSKYTNFLIVDGHVYVLDLDGMRRRVDGDIEGLVQAQEERLFRNWHVSVRAAQEAKDIYLACRHKVLDRLAGWL